jgi:hypothetical protein
VELQNTSISVSVSRTYSGNRRLVCRPMQRLHDAASSKLPAPRAGALAQRKLPHRVRKRSGDYHPGADAIQVMTMKVSKGLEFSVVSLPGMGHMPAPGEDEKEAARVFYVAATRATQRLVMGVGGDNGFALKLI